MVIFLLILSIIIIILIAICCCFCKKTIKKNTKNLSSNSLSEDKDNSDPVKEQAISELQMQSTEPNLEYNLNETPQLPQYSSNLSELNELNECEMCDVKSSCHKPNVKTVSSCSSIPKLNNTAIKKNEFLSKNIDNASLKASINSRTNNSSKTTYLRYCKNGLTKVSKATSKSSQESNFKF
jgi:hypothetical protein